MSPRMALGVVALLLAATAPPLAQGEPLDPVRPVAAVAVGMGPSAVVAWVPGPEAPDFFKIYGVRDETLAFLSIADGEATSATVEGGFPQYAVTAVRNGSESEPAIAVLGVGLVCVTVYPGIPPGFGVDWSCTAKVGAQVGLMATAWNSEASGPALAVAGVASPCVTVSPGVPPGIAVGSSCGSEPASGVGLACVRVEPGIPPGVGVDWSCTPMVGVPLLA